MKKSSDNRRIFSIFLRYIFLLVIGVLLMVLFYLIFSPLTIYPIKFLLDFFYKTSLSGNTIFVKNIPLEIINACIAGSAYFLLLFLNLSVPDFTLIKRARMILFAFIAFLIINVIRIFLLSLLAIGGSSLFDITHKIFWYGVSVFLVAAIWFLEVKLFNIQPIPIYSDLKFLAKRAFKK